MLRLLFCHDLSSTARSFPVFRGIQGQRLITSSRSPFREYATNKPAQPSVKDASRPRPLSAPLPRRPPPKSTATSMEEFRRLKRIDLVEKIFNEGHKSIYRASRKTTNFRLSAWGLCALASLGIGYFYTNDLLDYQYFLAINHDHPVLVLVAFAATTLFLGAAASWTLLKAKNHVHSIDLVQRLDAVFLQVTVRRIVPFLRRDFVIRPQDIVVNTRYVPATELPEGLQHYPPSESSPSAFTLGVLREGLKSISRFFYAIFDNARVFFSQEGIITLDVSEEKKGEVKVQQYYLNAEAAYLQHDDKTVLWELVELKDPLGYR